MFKMGMMFLHKQEFYKLIRDIDPMPRNKPVVNLFLLLDDNSDGSIYKYNNIAEPRVMVTINKKQLSIFVDVMKFAKDASALLREFEVRDENYTNKLNLDTFIMVLKKNNSLLINWVHFKATILTIKSFVQKRNNIKLKLLQLKQMQLLLNQESNQKAKYQYHRDFLRLQCQLKRKGQSQGPLDGNFQEIHFTE